ncbi:MAG: helix-turn-helix domain-containing protein [Actinomycetota bacterium]
MDDGRRPPGATTIDLGFAPQLRHAAVPVEVIEWSELMERMPEPYVARRQRAQFNQLILCTGGCGVHTVDFSPVSIKAGTMLRVRPGQVQQFQAPPSFDARMVIWPVESDPPVPYSPTWFPGSVTPATWELDPSQHDRMLAWAGELRFQQEHFDGSPVQADLIRAVLRAMLLVVEVELRGNPTFPDSLPQAYIDLRQELERDIARRPSVTELARRLGYSTRTLDRACQQVSGQTARQVVDERIALEIRRHLADTSRSIAQIRTDLGHHDPSNFTRFVVRHLGQSPAEFRQQLP